MLLCLSRIRFVQNSFSIPRPHPPSGSSAGVSIYLLRDLRGVKVVKGALKGEGRVWKMKSGHKSGTQGQAEEWRPRATKEGWQRTIEEMNSMKWICHHVSSRSHHTDSSPPEQDSDQLWQATRREFREPRHILSHKCPSVIWIYDNIHAAGGMGHFAGAHCLWLCCLQANKHY